MYIFHISLPCFDIEILGDQAGISFKKAAEVKLAGKPEGNAAGSLFENAAKCFINANNMSTILLFN